MTLLLIFHLLNIQMQDYEGVNLVSLGDGTINGKRLSIFIGRITLFVCHYRAMIGLQIK